MDAPVPFSRRVAVLGATTAQLLGIDRIRPGLRIWDLYCGLGGFALHLARALVVPRNITILPLPPRSPELNPVENIWQFMRDNWLSNRVFETYEDIVEAACDA